MLTRRPRLQLGCVFGSGLHLIASCASGSRSARSSSSALKFKRKRRAFCFVVRHRDNIPHWRTKVFTPGRPTLGTGWSVLSLPCGARRPSESAPLDAIGRQCSCCYYYYSFFLFCYCPAETWPRGRGFCSGALVTRFSFHTRALHTV